MSWSKNSRYSSYLLRKAQSPGLVTFLRKHSKYRTERREATSHTFFNRKMSNRKIIKILQTHLLTPKGEHYKPEKWAKVYHQFHQMDVPFKRSPRIITLPLTRRVSYLARRISFFAIRVSFLTISLVYRKAHFVSEEKRLVSLENVSFLEIRASFVAKNHPKPAAKMITLLLTSSVTGEAGDVFLSKIFTWLPGNRPLWRFLPRAYRDKVKGNVCVGPSGP